MKTIADAFAPNRQTGRVGLVPFIPAGYPNLEATGSFLGALEQGGATVIEVGFPFSDPIADGPLIQAAYNDVLQAGVSVRQIFQTLGKASKSISVPMAGMVSFSIVYRFGVDEFLKQAVDAGLGGLIIPDLPPPQADETCEKMRIAGLQSTLLISPTTTEARSKKVASLCTGFIYYLSVSGVTGERTSLPADISDKLKAIRVITDKPLCVGFGISTPQQVAQLKGHADAAIVGSAIVRKITENKSQSPATIALEIEQYCRSLLQI